MKFSFIARRRIWAVDSMCAALGVSRGGFYAWLTRPRSRRSRRDEELSVKVRASFIGSDRTYGADEFGVISWAKASAAASIGLSD